MIAQWLIRLYDWFAQHRLLRLALPIALALGALAGASQLRFKEDITDFLPNDHNYQADKRCRPHLYRGLAHRYHAA